MVRCIVFVLYFIYGVCACGLCKHIDQLVFKEKREKICFWFRFCCRRLRKNVLRFQCVHNNNNKRKKKLANDLGMGLCG